MIPLARRAYDGIASRIRNLHYRALGVNMRGYVWMRDVEIPRNWSDITLEPRVALDRGVSLVVTGAPSRTEKLLIRSGTYVNRFTIFDVHERLEVGRDCMIGPFCYFTDANHGVASGLPVKSQPMRIGPVVIEDDVWIGAHVTVLAGVRIGSGAVVGAGSVVTRDVPRGTIVAGVPAQVIGART